MTTRTRSVPRVYVPDEIAVPGVRPATPGQAHHIARVLRLAPGDALILFDGQGVEYDARIERIGRNAVDLRVTARRAVDRESPLAVLLAQGISSGERMDYTVQKAVELGVFAIQPLATERSVVRLTGERAARRIAHWQAVAIAACEQCGRNRVPPVLPVLPFAEWLARRDARGVGLMLTPGAAATLRALGAPAGSVVLLAGPEGGLAPRERADACGAGFVPISLGPRVLRTETAAIAALAALQVLWGDL